MRLYTKTLLFIFIVSFSNVFSQDIEKQCKKAKYDAQQSRLRAKDFASDELLALHQYKMEFSFYLKAPNLFIAWPSIIIPLIEIGFVEPIPCCIVSASEIFNYL